MNSDKFTKAREFAHRHELGELTLKGNLGGVYGYSRIFNAEICAYERGWEECLAKAKKYILEHTTVPYETDENGEVLAESFIQANKTRMEIVEDFEKYIDNAEE